MLHDRLAQDLYTEICRIPLIDVHSHIDPRRPTARNLDDILNAPSYTALAQAAGMEPAAVGPEVVPCLGADELVFHLDKPEVRQRLAKATAVEVGDTATLRQGVTRLFESLRQHGAKACVVSMPTDFRLMSGPLRDGFLSRMLQARQ